MSDGLTIACARHEKRDRQHAFLRGRSLRDLLFLVICVVVLSAGALAEDDIIDSAAGGIAPRALAAVPSPVITCPPAGYRVLPAFPRFFWSYGCVPTAGAMLVGYYDNAGFPCMFRNADDSDALCPTGNYPNDNGIFLKSGDARNKYPSRCSLSATEQGVLGRETFGHVDDYYVAEYSTEDPYYSNTPPIGPRWTPHTTDDCVADFMGTNISRFRGQVDGSSMISFSALDGAIKRFLPPRYPYTNPSSTPYAYIDAIYGLSDYIVRFAGYHCTTRTAGDQTQFDSVADYYSRTVKGYKNDDNGVTEEDIANEIDAGRPVIATAVMLNSANQETTGRHSFPIFGYKWVTEQGQERLWMLAYDTWYEDAATGTSYRTIKFQTPDEAEYNVGGPSFTRESDGHKWKIYGFSFLNINNNARCPVPLGTNDSPSGTYEDEFDVEFSLPGNSRVHYDAKAPTPASPYVALDGNGDGSLTIDHDCTINFRTYRDATPPDGYLASDVVSRVYSVFSANKNPKRCADSTSVTLVNGIVTYVVDSDTFYLEERDRRLFGIRVSKANHGLSVGDEVSVVVGSILTDTNSERYISATSLSTTTPTATIDPLLVTCGVAGGGDYLPEGGSGTGYGQLGVTGGHGINTVGLLVSLIGTVSRIGSNTVTVDDGSAVVDADDYAGVEVSASSVPQGLAVGDPVVVEGICSLRAQTGTGDFFPLVLATSVTETTASMVTSADPDGPVNMSWNLLSLPAVPEDPDPADLFDECPDSIAGGNLYRWDNPVQSLFAYDSWTPDEFGNLLIGTGYWLNICETDENQISYSAITDNDDRDALISLPSAGWGIIGCPFSYQVSFGDVRVTDGTYSRTVEEARGDGMLSTLMYWWSSSTQSLHDAGLEDDYAASTALDPWHGYWINTFRDDLALIVPHSAE